MLASGAFAASFTSIPIAATTVQLEAHFDGNALLASATAGPLNLPVGGVSLPGGGGPGGGGGIPTTGQTPIGGGPTFTGLGLPTAGLHADPDDG